MRLLTKDDESALRQYFDDIADSRPLAREQEVALAARIKLGDMEAREELVQANLRFVVDVAKNYQNRGLSLPELISAGNVGLMTAADRFDGTKGFTVHLLRRLVDPPVDPADHRRRGAHRAPAPEQAEPAQGHLQGLAQARPRRGGGAEVSSRSPRSSRSPLKRCSTPSSAPASPALSTRPSTTTSAP